MAKATPGNVIGIGLAANKHYVALWINFSRNALCLCDCRLTLGQMTLQHEPCLHLQNMCPHLSYE